MVHEYLAKSRANHHKNALPALPVTSAGNYEITLPPPGFPWTPASAHCLRRASPARSAPPSPPSSSLPAAAPSTPCSSTSRRPSPSRRSAPASTTARASSCATSPRRRRRRRRAPPPPPARRRPPRRVSTMARRGSCTAACGSGSGEVGGRDQAAAEPGARVARHLRLAGDRRARLRPRRVQAPRRVRAPQLPRRHGRPRLP